MSMSTHVTGVRELDGGKFKAMIELKHACEKAGVPYPPELKDYFKYPEEDEDNLKAEMEEVDLPKLAVMQYQRRASDIWQVNLADLPDEVVAIRFLNSY